MIDYQKIIHPSPQDVTQYSHFVLGADIGGTYTSITIGGLHNQKLTQLYSLQFKTKTLDSIIPAIQETLTYSKSEYNLEITDACLGAAGRLSLDQTNIQLTNAPLNISIP